LIFNSIVVLLVVEFPASVVLSVVVTEGVGVFVSVVGMVEELGGVVDDSCWHLGSLFRRISLSAGFPHFLMNKVEVEVVLSTYEVVKNVDVTVWYTVLVALTKEFHRFANGRTKKTVGRLSTSKDDP